MHTLPSTELELAAWLRLSLAPGLKPAALRLLLSAFGLPAAILQQEHETLAAIAGEAAARAALAPTGPEFDAQLDAVIWATCRFGARRRASGRLVAPERRMSSW